MINFQSNKPINGNKFFYNYYIFSYLNFIFYFWRKVSLIFSYFFTFKSLKHFIVVFIHFIIFLNINFDFVLLKASFFSVFLRCYRMLLGCAFFYYYFLYFYCVFTTKESTHNFILFFLFVLPTLVAKSKSANQPTVDKLDSSKATLECLTLDF